MSVKHTKVSTIADGTDTDRVRPSDWNAEHTVALTDSEIPATIARDAEVTADIATHAALPTVHQDAPTLIGNHAALTATHGVAGTIADADDLTAHEAENDAHSISRTATLVVAANDSSALSKAQADYVCDGTADDVEIQAALDALPTVGGTVVLLEGTFNISAIVNIVNGGTTLRGQGYGISVHHGVTILRAVNGTNLTAVLYTDQHNTIIQDLYIDGNKANNPTANFGLYIDGTDDGTFEKLGIMYCKDSGIYINAASSCVFSKIWSEYSDQFGIETLNGDTLIFEGVYSALNANRGFWIQGARQFSFIGCGADVNDDAYGFTLFLCVGVTIADSYIYQSDAFRGRHGIQIQGSTHCIISNNLIYQAGNAAHNTNDAIVLATQSGIHSTHNIFTGNQIWSDHGNLPRYGINEWDANQDYNQYYNNDIMNTATAPMNIQGLHSVAYGQHYDTYEDVLASSANLVVNAKNFVNGAIALTGVNPNYPRGLVFAITAGVTDYTLTVVGVTAKGQTVTEVYTFADDGLAWSSDNAFDTVTSITLADRAGAAATIDVGIDERLGLMNVIYETGDVWKITKNLTRQVVAGAQVDIDYDTYDMSVITLAATDDFVIWYRSNLNIIS